MRRLEDCKTAYQLESWLANLATHVENSVIDFDNLSKEFMETWFPADDPDCRGPVPVFHNPCGYVTEDAIDKLLKEAADDVNLALTIYTGYGNEVYEDCEEILDAIKNNDSDYFNDCGTDEDDAAYYYTELDESYFFE